DWGNREEAMACVELDYENIRAALSWAWEIGAIPHGLNMVGALRRFWDYRSFFREGLDWLERFLALAEAPRNDHERDVLWEAWTGVLVMAHRLERFEQAQEAGERALAPRREVRDKRQIAFAMNNLANPVSALGEYSRAQQLYEDCIALHGEVDNRSGQVFAF